MTRRFRCTMPLLAVMAATTAGAQEIRQPAGPQATANAMAATDSAQVTARPSAGPTTERAAAGIRAPRAEANPPTPAPRPAETSQNKAMMVVGAAGLIVGAIIGDTAGTLIMVGSAVIGLFGLYKYLE